MKQETFDNKCTEDEEGNDMPAIELVEYERVAYIKDMEDYLLQLKRMSNEEAKKVSRDKLIKSQIIQENGEFSDRYKFSKMNAQKKR